MSTIKEKVTEKLKEVYDPEIPVNVFDLGLIYEIEVKDDSVVHVTMTLTAPACPVAGEIVFNVEQKIREVEEVTDAHVNMTFDPPWNKEMMSEEALLELDLM